MAITAAVSSAELAAQVDARFVGKYYEGLLVNANGVTYTPGTTNDTNFLSFEVSSAGGYKRQVFKYESNDQTAYSDQGVALATKGTVFAHDGSANSIIFTHAVLVWGSGNVQGLTFSVDPSNGVVGTYASLPTFTSGSGTGMTINVTITAGPVFAYAVNDPGTGYADNQQVEILESVLVAAGAASIGDGNATGVTNGVSTNSESGQIIAVAQTLAQATLDGGNEAAFYWDLKLFGIE